MKTPLIYSLALTAMASSAIADARQNQRSDGSYLHDVTRRFVTPHLDWMAPGKVDPISVLAITPRRYGAREVVELAQRFPIEFEAVVGVNFSNLTVNSIYENQVQGTSAYEKEAELMQKLQKPYEVYLLGNFQFAKLPEHAQYKILKAVSEGAGLVVVYPDKFPYPKVLAEPTEGWEQIVGGVSLTALPASVAGKAPGDLLKTYRFGKGRVAMLHYGSQLSRLGLTPPDPYTPFGWKARYENSIALAGRTLQWAAGRELSARLSNLQPDRTLLAGQRNALSLDLSSPEGSISQLRLRNEWNEVVWSGEKKSSGQQELLLPPLPAGKYYLDVRWEKEGKVAEVGFLDFKVASPVGNVVLRSGKASYEAGENVELLVKLEKALDRKAKITLTLDDLPDKNRWVIQEAILPAGTQEQAVTITAPHVPTVAGVLRAAVSVEGKALAQAHTILFFPRREIEIFPTILWENIHGELAEMAAAQIRQSTNDAAALTHPGPKGAEGRLSAYFNQRFVPYLTRIGLGAGENGHTENRFWLGMTKEEVDNATRGDGSFYNPAVREFWKQTIARRQEGLPEIGPMIYTLGDENHFSYEAGYSPADNQAFAAFLKETYGNIETLNAEWGTRFSSMEEVGHPTPAEMRDNALYPQWYAHRRFMEKQYADLHHGLAAMIKENDPHAIVGAEGSVPGDLEQTIKKLEFWGPYKDTVYDELLRTIGAEKIRAIWWGYGGEYLAYPLWSPLLKGIVNGNQWYSASVEAVSGLLAADFTLAKYYEEERKPFVDRLDAGAAQLLIKTPLKKSEIAILWSHASYSASLMDDRFYSPRDATVQLLDISYEQGLNVDLITSSMVEQGKLEEYRVLVLPGASAFSAAETTAVEDFVRRGGLVIADLNPAILNDSCGPLPASRLGALFGVPDLKGNAALAMKPVSINAQLGSQKIAFEAAKALQSPEAPLFQVAKHGQGHTVLLNFNLSSARNTATTPFDDFILSLFAAGGIRPSVQVSGINQSRSVLRLRQSGDYHLIGLLAGPSEVGKKARLTLPSSGWVYEVDSGLIGQVKELEVDLSLPFRLYSVFSRRAASPEWSLSSDEATPGVPIALVADALEENGVYRLEIERPDGELLKRATRVFAGKNVGQPLRFAFSDAPGRYQLTLTDVRTGLKSRAELTLRSGIAAGASYEQ